MGFCLARVVGEVGYRYEVGDGVEVRFEVGVGVGCYVYFRCVFFCSIIFVIFVFIRLFSFICICGVYLYFFL